MRAANAHSWCGLAVSLFGRIVGFGLGFGTVRCCSLVVFFFLSVVGDTLPRYAYLAANLGDGWNCVM